MTIFFWDGNIGPYQAITEFEEPPPPLNSAIFATLLLLSTILSLPFSLSKFFAGRCLAVGIG